MSPIELETCGIVWSLNHCKHYLRGCNLIKLHVDHLPLVTLLQAPMQNLSERMMRMKAEILDYRLEVLYISGKRHQIADCLGRRPLLKEEEEWKYYDPLEAMDQERTQGCLLAYRSQERILDDPAYSDLFMTAENDVNYKMVVAEVKKGRAKGDLRLLPDTHPARAYCYAWDLLSIHPGPQGHQLLLMDGDRIVVPEGCRKRILKQLHLPHQGMTKTGELARSSYYWTNIKNEVRQMCRDCELCTTFAKSLPDEVEIIDPNPPTEPLDKVACNLFHFDGEHYLMVIDEFSNYGFHHKYKNTPCSAEVINVLETWYK
jgi:hypothetical protein